MPETKKMAAAAGRNAASRAQGKRHLKAHCWLGAVLLGHFAVVCAIKAATGATGQIVWLSHFGLLIAGVGLIVRSPMLIAVAFVDVLVLHGIWLVDCICGLAGGTHPLGVTSYLNHADIWDWIATAHHFYLAPLLIVLIHRQRSFPVEALPAAVAVYLILTVISRGVLSPADNINYAWGVPVAEYLPLIAWGNQRDGSFYLVGLNAFVFVYMLLPAFLIGRRLAGVTGREKTATPAMCA